MTVKHDVEGGQPDSEVASSVSDRSHHGRFLPGTRVADRYRIVSLVGKGGMGEVYRADDLKLGHTVALKFLPKDLADDPQRLEYFHSEVRLTRQISHPNVCRVYDIGEVDGQHFLSMEYIDGEDLRILLRRIGRLPKDKGIEIAQQLCAGLAAAQNQGVVHRDLKPANIMIDGRGQVRITDFGLARLTREGRSKEFAGTPAYMAPEQLAHGETSHRSDVYSLGLILYELFTGEAVHKTGSVPELLRAHEESPLSRPSDVVDDIAPAVEQVILRCLAEEPQQRPPSAHAVAAALPGADPLAAALAAGETPSPGVVAAAGEVGTVGPTMGTATLAMVVVGIVAVLTLSQFSRLHNLTPLEAKPDVLVNQAQQTLRSLGYINQTRNMAYGFDYSRGAITWLQSNSVEANWRQQLRFRGPTSVFFWYRESAQHLVSSRQPTQSGNPTEWGVTLDDPPLHAAGMVSVVLDASGRLLEFVAVPSPHETEDSKTIAPSDPRPDVWAQLFRSAQLDRQLFVERVADEPIPVYADQVKAWNAVGAYPDFPSAAIHIEAASFAGRPVYFRIRGPWDRQESRVASGRSTRPPTGDLLTITLNVLLLVAGALIALHNLRLGRCDRKGATRLAAVSFVAWMGTWLFAETHSFSPIEYASAMAGLKGAVFGAVEVWVYYVALEPYIRHFWPKLLVSWTRLLSGRVDPLVGRDVLIGACAGVGFVCIEMLIDSVPGWLGWTMNAPSTKGISLLGREGGGIAFFLYTVPFGLKIALFYITLMLLVMRIALRSQLLAAGAFVAWNGYYFGSVAEPLVVSVPLYALGFGLVVVVLARHGLLAIAVMWIVRNSLAFPLTPDLTAWYGRPGLIMVSVIILVAGYGLWKALGGQPVVRRELLDVR